MPSELLTYGFNKTAWTAIQKTFLDYIALIKRLGRRMSIPSLKLWL